MAAVATLRTPEPVFVGGGLAMVLATVAMDSSYPTGGEAVTPGQFRLGTIEHMTVGTDPTTGIVGSYVRSTATTGKIKCFWVDITVDGAALAEVVDTTDIATTTAIPVTVWGRP